VIGTLLRIAAWALGGLVAALVGVFLLYDFFAFQSRRPQIDALIARAAPSERDAPEALGRLMLASVKRRSTETARILLMRLNVPTDSRSWQPTWASWSLLVRLHLSDSQRIAILTSQTTAVPGTFGYSAGAEKLFRKPLRSLDEEELATLVALASWPDRLSLPENRDRLLELRDRLLVRARERR
jgi:hypothetical protein